MRYTFSVDEETRTEQVNEALAKLTADAKEVLAEAGHIRPHEAAEMAMVGLEYLELAFSLAGDQPFDTDRMQKLFGGFDNEDWDSFTTFLTDKALARLILQIPITEGPGNADPDAAIRKHFAVDVADEIGPDWAQALYRFAVLVTKLA